MADVWKFAGYRRLTDEERSMAQDVRPGNRIDPTEPEPEYAKIKVPVRDVWDGMGQVMIVDLVVCTRCGCYVWNLQAHEDWHRR